MGFHEIVWKKNNITFKNFPDSKRLSLLTMVMDSRVYAFSQTHQIVYIKDVHFFV